MYDPQQGRCRRQSARTLLVLLLDILLVALPAVALAQAPSPDAGLTIDSATLQVWPEYDDPGILVIFAGTFSNGTTFPRQVAFPVPQGIRGVQATENDPAQGLLTQPWQVNDGKLVYTLPSAGFHIEYYVDRTATGNQRALAYTFVAPYPIRQLQVEVLQPARATAFQMTPRAEGSAQGQSGLTVYRFSRSHLDAGNALPIAFRYTKADENPSVTAVPPQAAAAAQPVSAPSGPAGAGTSLVSLLPWFLIGLGVTSLIGALAYLLLQSRQTATPPPARGLQRPVLRAEPRSAPPGSGAAFCPRCGRRFRPDDQFCARCGAPRR